MKTNQRVLAAIVLASPLVVALPRAAADVVPIARVTELPRDVLETKPDVAERGIVIRTRPGKKDLILEDSSGGIWVDVDKLAVGTAHRSTRSTVSAPSPPAGTGCGREAPWFTRCRGFRSTCRRDRAASARRSSPGRRRRRTASFPATSST